MYRLIFGSHWELITSTERVLHASRALAWMLIVLDKKGEDVQPILY